MLAALANVRATHLLDKGLWGRLGLEVAHESDDTSDVCGSEDDLGEPLVPVSRLAEGLR